MKTIMIDGNQYETAKDLHRGLQRMLNLPEYYGCNADALNDCLSESMEPLQAWIFSRGTGEVAKAVTLCAQVIEDNNGTVKEL